MVAKIQNRSKRDQWERTVILVTTRDGSIIAGIDESLDTSAHSFVAHEEPMRN